MVVDIQASSDRYIYPAPDLYNDYFGISYKAGARIMSNSWGAPAVSSYTSLERLVDKFMYDHDDFTIVFAAGNDGERGKRTIGLPASAKNCIAVGAVLSSSRKYSEDDNPVSPTVDILDKYSRSISVSFIYIAKTLRCALYLF